MIAAGVNPADRKVRSGAARDFLSLAMPAIPGREAVGVVDGIGNGVRGVSIGNRVFGLGGVTGATAGPAVLSAWAPHLPNGPTSRPPAPVWHQSPRSPVWRCVPSEAVPSWRS